MLGAGRPVPDAVCPIASLPGYAVVFFVGAIGEELGWQGYAAAVLQGRYGALQTALMAGPIWAGRHVIPYLQTRHTLSWVASQCVRTIAARVLMVWISRNAGGSVFVCAIFHMMIDVGEFMFPNYGSHYDPFIAATLMAALAGLVSVLWGPKTLARFRFART